MPQQPLKKNTIRHLLAPGISVESPSSGVPDDASSSREHENVDQRRISDDNHSAEIAAFIGWTSRHQISHKPSPKGPESPMSQSNRQLQPHGQHLDSPLSQNRTQPPQQALRQPISTDLMPSPRREFEEMSTQSKTLPVESPRSIQRTWEKPNGDGADLQTLKDRIGSSNPSSSQFLTSDETQPIRNSFEEPVVEPETSEENDRNDLSSGPSHLGSPPPQPLRPGLATHPSSPARQRCDEKLESPSPADSTQQPLSPRSRYLAAVTRPFPANSTVMLSKVRNDQEPSARAAAIQPKQRDASNHQIYGKPKAAQSYSLENQQRMFTPEHSVPKIKPVTPERYRIQQHEVTQNLSAAGRTMDPPSSSSRAIDGSNETKMETQTMTPDGMTKVASSSSFVPEKRSTRTLEDYRDLYRAQNQPHADMVLMKSHPSPSMGPASPRATHHFPTSPSSESALLRKATQRVRNREGKDGSSTLQRQFNKVKKQATAPTMSYAEANAELRWVKSQQRILESMKVNVDSKGSGANLLVQKGHGTEELVDPNNIEELNKRVNRVRMQLIKVTLEENEEREARDDMGNDRDDLGDLDVHYGREYGDARERKYSTFRNSISTRE